MSYNEVGKHMTKIGFTDGMNYVHYHKTDVVRWNDNKVVLNTGGWSTNTTKKRMNQVSMQFDLGYTVYQKDFAWYVLFKGEVLDFKDGMVLSR